MKNFLKEKKNFISILSLGVVSLGLFGAVALVQQNQNISEKAGSGGSGCRSNTSAKTCRGACTPPKGKKDTSYACAWRATDKGGECVETSKSCPGSGVTQDTASFCKQSGLSCLPVSISGSIDCGKYLSPEVRYCCPKGKTDNCGQGNTNCTGVKNPSCSVVLP